MIHCNHLKTERNFNGWLCSSFCLLNVQMMLAVQLFLSSIDLANICQRWTLNEITAVNPTKHWHKIMRERKNPVKLWMKMIVEWRFFMNESHVVTINSHIHSHDKLLLKVQFKIGLQFMNGLREPNRYSCACPFSTIHGKINHNAYDHITASPAHFKTHRITHERFCDCRQSLTIWNCTVSVLHLL